MTARCARRSCLAIRCRSSFARCSVVRLIRNLRRRRRRQSALVRRGSTMGASAAETLRAVRSSISSSISSSSSSSSSTTAHTSSALASTATSSAFASTSSLSLSSFGVMPELRAPCAVLPPLPFAPDSRTTAGSVFSPAFDFVCLFLRVLARATQMAAANCGESRLLQVFNNQFAFFYIIVQQQRCRFRVSAVDARAVAACHCARSDRRRLRSRFETGNCARVARFAVVCVLNPCSSHTPDCRCAARYRRSVSDVARLCDARAR